MTRRRALAAGTLGVGGVLAGGPLFAAMLGPTPPAPDWPPLALDLGGVVVTAVRTGGVAVKRAHRE